MTRPLLTQTLALRRTVVHYARPPRVPIQKSPFVPTPPRSSAGTSTPNPSSQKSNDTAVELENGLTFHHNPPPSAPSYTTGVVPPLLRWTKGESVGLSGEEGARVRRERSVGEVKPEWMTGLAGEIKGMREAGKSRKEIGDKLNIPETERYLIARVADLNASTVARKAKSLEQRKASWRPRKALAREIREKRKEFW